MKLQTLVSTVNSNPRKLVQEMNIQSDTIIINQAESDGYKEFVFRDNIIQVFTFSERGVGLSRNNAIMRSIAEISLIADNDIKYVDGYEDIVINAFKQRPDVDIIFFNFTSNNPDRPEYIIERESAVRWFNSLRYGAFRIAFRTDSVRKAGLSFSLLFGGGAKYSSGEDSLFIYKAIRSGLKAHALPINLGTVDQDKSTWFKGHNRKFFEDKGSLFAAISKRWGRVFCIYYVLRNYESFDTNLNRRDIIQLLFNGFNSYE